MCYNSLIQFVWASGRVADKIYLPSCFALAREAGRHFDSENDMKQIPLTQGKVALVDDDIYEYLMQWKWYAHFAKGKWYARRKGGKWLFQKTIRMHRVIMNVTDPKILVDHRNGDGLNNQSENLRICTYTQNSHNASKHADNTSGYKGVSWHKATGKFQAQIRVNGEKLHLGLFSTAEEASDAYDEAAKKHHGEFAKTNS